MHNGSDIELIHPGAGLVHTQDGSLALILDLDIGGYELLPDLFFVKLGVFFPIVKMELFQRFVQKI
jgi:hypothetical protein